MRECEARSNLVLLITIKYKEKKNERRVHQNPEQVLSDLHSDGSGGLTKEQAEQSRKSMVPIPLSGKVMNPCLKDLGCFHRAYAFDADLCGSDHLRSKYCPLYDRWRI